MTTEEEEWQKRNTDCVYFLASPLTCKKGIDCEYRHNEIARLNPRDCWYWMAGNCLNPGCGFRHPPLESHVEEAPLENASQPEQSSVPASKTNVPCYFYYNGFCNKGGTCSFLHGPDDMCAKTSSTVTNMHLLDTKTTIGKDDMSVSTEEHLKHSEKVPKATVESKLQPKEDVKLLAARENMIPMQAKEDLKQLTENKNMIPQTHTFQIVVSSGNEAAVLESDSLLPEKGYIQATDVCLDESSEELVDDHVEPEERWESSPGFDVLVDNISETLVYEDEQEFLQTIDSENLELNKHFLRYDFENSIEYDAPYCDDILHKGELYGAYDHVDGLRVFDDVGKNSDYSGVRTLDSLLSRKRKLLPMELEINDRRGGDLRERLRKHRVIDGRPFSRSSRRHNSSRQLSQSEERCRRHGTSERPSRRFASEVEKNAFKSDGSSATHSNGAKECGWHRHSQSHRASQHNRGKKLPRKQFLSSQVVRKPVPRDMFNTQSSEVFNPPKTLAQIKEEKKKAEETADFIGKTGYSGTTASTNFQGPKPLSEILKDKKKLC